MTHEYQKLNHCGPVALAIALSYYGVERTQFDIALLVKGYDKDKNVSSEEMLAGLVALGDNGACGRNPRPALARCLVVGVEVRCVIL
jgi:hypothetical protein